MDDPNITMEEYIRLEEEKAHRRGKVYNWETDTYGKIWDNEDVHNLGSIETKLPAVVFNDTLTSEIILSCEPMVSSLNDNKIDFRISFDESDEDDCTNEFLATVYNDALTSKLDFLTEHVVCPQHIDEFDLNEEASLSKCDEEEQNVLYFNDLFSFNVIYPHDLKSDPGNDNDTNDIKQPSGICFNTEYPGEWILRVNILYSFRSITQDYESLIIPIKELRLDDKLNFVEEPVEIIDREVKQLKQSHIPIVKVTRPDLDVPLKLVKAEIGKGAQILPTPVVKAFTIAGEVVTTASVEIPKELTLAQTLIEIKSAKPKAVTTAATTAKDKGKAKMVEPEKPLKKKDQIAINKEVARNLEAQLQAELEEEERLSRQKEEEANIALIESWDNTQAMMDADFQLAQQMQTEEQEQLSIEEKSKLFVELLEKRKKHFAALRAQEKRSKPPTKAQKRNTMSTYLKNMAGYKHNQLKSKSYDEIQEMFDKEMKRVNTFVDMNAELVKGSKTKAEGSSKRAGDELESDKSKKQKIDEHVEAEKDDDQEEAEMKKHIEIVKDDEVAIDAIPLATKPPMIVEYKIVKEGKFGYFQLIRADGSSKRYLSMIKMLQNIDREDLETLWKLVKAKHGNTRPEEDYERILWGDLKVMFKPDIKSEVWRNLQGYKVNIWKLFDTCEVHFVSSQSSCDFATNAIIDESEERRIVEGNIRNYYDREDGETTPRSEV
ncbi:hypothetical protein Tco_0453642 [Tanacetum coccineum]